MSDISIKNGLEISLNTKKALPPPAIKAVVVKSNNLPVIYNENIALEQTHKSKGKIPSQAIQLAEPVKESFKGSGYQMILNDAIVNDSKQLKDFVTRAAMHSDDALGRVFIETGAFYPDKLEDVLKYSAEKDIYQMKSVVNKVYKAAGKHGITVKDFPTGNITRAAAVNSAKSIVKAGVVGIPLDMAFNIFSYNSGKIDEKQFMAKSLNGFFTWSAFEAGIIGTTAIASTIVGRKISPFAKTALGVGVGMIASSLYHKTVGHTVEEKLAEKIPESVAKPVAVTLNNYFAKPVNKYVIDPIKNNPKTSIAVGVALAAALTVKYPVGFGKNFLLGMGAATGIGVAGNLGLNYIMPDHKTVSAKGSETSKSENAGETDSKVPEKALCAEDLKNAFDIEARYKADPSSVSDQEALQYANVLERFEKLDEGAKEKLISEYQALNN